MSNFSFCRQAQKLVVCGLAQLGPVIGAALFATGQAKAAVDYSHLHERSLLQAVSATAVSNRLDHSQLARRWWNEWRARWISSEPRVIAEYGPGEGVHSREIARRMPPGSQLLLFELDPAFSRDLERQFADDPRVHVINGDAATIRPRNWSAAASRTATTSFPEFRSAFSRSKKNAPCFEKRMRRSRPVALSSFIRSRTNCASTPRFSIAPSPNISCRTFRRCSSPFSAKPANWTETAHRSSRRPRSFSTNLRHDGGSNPASKRIRWAKCPSRRSRFMALRRSARS